MRGKIHMQVQHISLLGNLLILLMIYKVFFNNKIWQSLDDGRYALMKAKISSVIHDDTKYQKGMLHMRTQKCFAVKVCIPYSYLNYAITSVYK